MKQEMFGGNGLGWCAGPVNDTICHTRLAQEIKEHNGGGTDHHNHSQEDDCCQE